MLETFAPALDRALDASIVLSFDRTGFLRHKRSFDPRDLEVDLSGRTVLITGANSGLGRATAEALARKRAEVVLLCRSLERGREAQAALVRATGNEKIRLEQLDVSSLASIQSFAARFTDPRVDVLIHCAGVLPPKREMTADGVELTWATNVLGPFALTHLLLPKLRSAPSARLIFVSSGGMYGVRLDLSDLDWEKRRFDGVTAYAMTKRAQVILAELWAEWLEDVGITVASMHPGWADTPAVRTSLPRFHRVMRHRLRTPEEGADTIVWLAAAERVAGQSGRFWFDRRPVKTHLARWTEEREIERGELWSLLRKQAGLTP